MMNRKNDMIHSGTLSYLNSVHRKYGVWKYYMHTLKQWSDGKYTVEFREKKDETKTERTA